MNGDDLRSVGFFEFLSPEELVEFAEASELVTYTPGETLIEEGSEPSSLFVLTFGHVEVSKRIPGHGERILAEIDAANEKTVVGERGLLDSRGASATVRAKGEVEAIKIPREKFRAMISAGDPAAYKLATRITRILARRLVRLDEEVVETIRELEDRGETDLDVFRDKLVTEWTV
ncbi:MAG TPA: cyclic nucleotide-binding domain-containing protein [Rubrobacteraceae bacterium]|nr:cyclic nucleotide-binding domain-containing protein [Rubrobacteraceae bacterium]